MIITASPRKDGNCRQMAAAFAERLEEAGYSSKEYDAGRLRVSGCAPDESGAAADGKCRKWFEDLSRDVDAADALVFVVPVYVYGFPAQLAAVVEGLMRGREERDAFKGRKCMLISCCAQKKMDVFSGVKFTYERLAEYCGLENVGELLIPRLWRTKDAARRGAASHAYYFAEDLIRAFRKSAASVPGMKSAAPESAENPAVSEAYGKPAATASVEDMKPGFVAAAVIGNPSI